MEPNIEIIICESCGTMFDFDRVKIDRDEPYFYCPVCKSVEQYLTKRVGEY